MELLAPAGNSEALAAAIGEGADAVYLGLKDFNARLRSANFAYSQFEGALRTVHNLKRKVYVAVNTIFTERETDRVYQLLKYLAALRPDGIIVQDFGIVKMVKECFPSLKIHSSTQMNVASSRACNVLSKQNVSRVVLARELSLEEIKTIRSKTNVELEVFVHGALCISASGLCLFSSFLGGKSANRGMCTQACRRLYTVNDESGYYFSPFDLQLLEQAPQLCAAGINAIKIEGRMKSAEYVGAVVRAYRSVIDAIPSGQEAQAIHDAQQILRNDFAREKTMFHFIENNPSVYLNPEQDGGTGIKLGVIKKIKKVKKVNRPFQSEGKDESACGTACGGRPFQSEGENESALGTGGLCGLVECGGMVPAAGDSIRLHKADDSARKTHKLAVSACFEAGLERTGAVWLDIPDGFDVGDTVYLVQTKSFSHRYAPVVPKDLSPFKRQPGRDTAPGRMPQIAKKPSFPAGLYVSVGHIEDLYIAQAVKPVQIVLSINQKNIDALLNTKTPLPFKSTEMILNFDPFYNEALDSRTMEQIEKLIARGYKNYMVNNLAHISILAPLRKELNIIAGPYLYTFNKYAAEFINDMGIDSIVSPFENSRQNLEKTFSEKERASIFIIVFSYPALFRIQSNLGSMYQFKSFKDSKDAEFRLIGDGESTVALPKTPFAISDKIPFLQAARFNRFILDFSPERLQKKFYKEIMQCAKMAAPVPNAVRFNWKNGFFSNDGARAESGS
ncbi:MAG: U32 family peptidase [Spirochaetaceae bacterium]|jgi:putative protease|nr:U32 family peptidase [Spirochaetaceae bacterium]